jgi:hypothetical protein
MASDSALSSSDLRELSSSISALLAPLTSRWVPSWFPCLAFSSRLPMAPSTSVSAGVSRKSSRNYFPSCTWSLRSMNSIRRSFPPSSPISRHRPQPPFARPGSVDRSPLRPNSVWAVPSSPQTAHKKCWHGNTVKYKIRIKKNHWIWTTSVRHT